MRTCNLPPAGWHCNLRRGHGGPCPAWPDVIDVSASAEPLSPDKYWADYGGPLDTQVGGSHYQHDEIQPIQVIQAWRLRFESANVVKYLYRLGKKGDVGKALEDIDKAVHYLQLLRADIELRGI